MLDVETLQKSKPIIKNVVSEYKPSYYNYLYKTNTITLLYNTFTGALAELFGEDKAHVMALLHTPNNSELRKKHPGIWENLIENGFIINKEINELDMVKLRILKARFNVNHALGFTLVPTRACNCKCVYCFEESMNTTMSSEDCDATIAFMKARIEEVKPSFVRATWYGGEPLLVPDKIKYIGSELLRICKENDVRCSGNILTNGYLLTEQLALELKELNIRSIQITLDGPEEIHNKRRMLKNGGPTFQRIKKAILIAKKVFDKVIIRVHVDKETKNDVYELLKEDWLYGDNVSVTPGMLRDFSETCTDWRASTKALDSTDFLDMEQQLTKIMANRRGVELKQNWKRIANSLPVKGNYCGADYIGTLAIGPGALVYKCIGALNRNEECGYLKNGKLYPNHNYSKWLLYTALDNPDCRECNLLPLCMGGCPTIGKRHDKKASTGSCEYWRYNLRNSLQKISQQLALEQ